MLPPKVTVAAVVWPLKVRLNVSCGRPPRVADGVARPSRHSTDKLALSGDLRDIEKPSGEKWFGRCLPVAESFRFGRRIGHRSRKRSAARGKAFRPAPPTRRTVVRRPPPLW